MTLTTQSPPAIRPLHYRDLDAIDRMIDSGGGFETQNHSACTTAQQIATVRRWYGPLKCLSLFPNPLQHAFSAYVAEGIRGLRGFIQVAPFNQAGTTWRVERIVAGNPHLWPSETDLPGSTQDNLSSDVASSLLRHCLETIWRARLWLVEVDINDKLGIGLYRTNGFQPLAQRTYWSLPPALLAALSERTVSLPNLRPVSNADAALLYQLDTVSMPPLVRQAYDRHIADFRVSLAQGTLSGVRRLMSKQETVRGYVFEPQRKAAIGHFNLCISKTGSRPHTAQLTVHPAYTCLYPELLTQMAQLVQGYPDQALELASADYQTERETYLTQTGAVPERQTLMMFRSIWHKVRESKAVSLENLQLADVLQGLQPSRKPVPGRISLLDKSPSTKEDRNPTLPWSDAGQAGSGGDSPSDLEPPNGSGDQGGAWFPH
ncbi:MAG: GNAT family N-acetyltransferase [Cyanobacteria bacterium P01_A01_bin.135]